MQRISSLYIAPSSISGRGVFTADSIPRDSLIEICPVIILSEDDRELIHATKLHDFYFEWREDMKEAAIALGYGSLYNHSFQPNARYELDFDKMTIDIYSLHFIASGDEITVNYNGDPKDKSPVWFHK